MSRSVVLVDTSLWIEAMRKEGDPTAREAVQAHVRTGTVAFCDLVRLELWNGAGEAERSWLKKLDQDLPTVVTDDELWREARSLAERSRRLGVTVPATDLLVFACARVHRLELLHRDRHFDLLEELTS